jgi:hypothetical protein
MALSAMSRVPDFAEANGNGEWVARRGLGGWVSSTWEGSLLLVGRIVGLT